jgi:hypothetical protein
MVTRSCKNGGLFLCIMKNPGVYMGSKDIDIAII